MKLYCGGMTDGSENEISAQPVNRGAADERRNGPQRGIRPRFVIPVLIGPVLGGLLIDDFEWQSIFLVNVPRPC